jgi:hypothetical protein
MKTQIPTSLGTEIHVIVFISGIPCITILCRSFAMQMMLVQGNFIMKNKNTADFSGFTNFYLSFYNCSIELLA